MKPYQLARNRIGEEPVAWLSNGAALYRNESHPRWGEIEERFGCKMVMVFPANHVEWLTGSAELR